jgi:hypothetical protein
MSADASVVDVLQETLAAEHAAVYVYGVVGGRLSADENPLTAERFRSAYEAHRGRRDQLRAMISGLGGTPEAPAPAYEVPVEGSRDPRRLVGVALRTEERCAGFYAQQVAGSTGRHRRWAIEALTETAVRQVDLGAPAEAYPGAPEL